LKCKYFVKTPCLTHNDEKCAETYNEWNDKCPFYKIVVSERNKSEKNAPASQHHSK
jgi:hypothetical protein